nr:retrovirus-related Pol polyprotein from transposon TNT 1-94 [Tanacetum cinerariifolium]
VHDTYLIEQDAQNVIIDSLDMNYKREVIDQNDDDTDPAKEHKLSAQQETISILSQQKEAQIKLYKTQEDKELDKVIELEQKVKVLDNVVYKTGCYNDNLALMLAPDSDEVIRLEKESRSKLGDLIRPFDYDKLNNLYDLFVPQREKSSEQRYFSERSRLSHINVNNGKSKESFIKQTSLLEKRMHESIPLDKNLVEIVLFIVDSGYSKHMTRNLKLLINFVEKFLGTIKFRNDQIAPIIRYGEMVQGAITIKKVYYVEGLNHNLFSVGQFCDADLEVAFRKSTCFIRDLKGNDLLTGSRGTDLYPITLQDTNCPNPICLMAKASSSQAWLWHRRLSYLKFDTINLLSKNDIVVGLPKLKFVKDHLCSSCELGKAKQKSFHTKLTPSSKRRLQLLHMDLCGHMRVASINGIRYILVIVDDYSRYTWTHFLRSKDETPKVLIGFLRLVQQGLQAPVRVGFFTKRPLLEHLNKTALLKDGTVHLLRDGENLNKMKEKGDEYIFVGYSTQSKAYRVFNKRTRVIMESIHVNFDELPQMASDHISFDPAPECQRMALNHDSLSPAIQRQANVPQADTTVTTSNKLDLLFSLMFDELLNGSSKVVSKSSTVCSADAPNPQTHTENDQVADDEFINILCTPVQDQGETSSCHVDLSNIHIFYQRYPFEHRWTKDHPLEQVIGNPSEYIRTRRQLESDAKMCMFALTVSRTEPKNIKEAMADSAWIESMQEELHKFDRLDVWELVDRPLCTNVINLKWL